MIQPERADLILGTFIIITIQFVLIFLIMNYEFKFVEVPNSPFSLKVPMSYLVVIPRFISSLMMHIQVEEDTRNGLRLMKYAINHPQNFVYAQ